MANTTLKTRIILNNRTTDEWAANSTFVGLKSEFLVDTTTRKIKIGDGTTTYADLPFATLTPEEVKSLIDAAVGAVHTHSNKAILDATTASFTSGLLSKLNGIADGANKTTVDSALSSTSTNPVQNKIVNAALSDKLSTSTRGAKNGVAPLDENAKILATYFPNILDLGDSNV